MTYSMSTAAARKASKKTQHVRSAGDWITLILLVAGALLVLFPLLVLTVNAFKTSADYNATGPLSRSTSPWRASSPSGLPPTSR